jgi:hypothetical protein
MIVILCEPDDHSGLWLASELEPREKVARIVLPEKLIVGSQLSLRIDEQAVDAAVRQADGRVIDGKSVAAIVNRMQHFPVPVLQDASNPDLVYAAEEDRAAIVAWSFALDCPVLFPPPPYGAARENASDIVWRCRATALGIPAEPIAIGSNDPGEAGDPGGGGERNILRIGERTLTRDGADTPDSPAASAGLLAVSSGLSSLAMRFRAAPDAAMDDEW